MHGFLSKLINYLKDSDHNIATLKSLYAAGNSALSKRSSLKSTEVPEVPGTGMYAQT